MEARGVPTALLLTEPFVPMARRLAAVKGVAYHPVTAVPHPVSSVSVDDLKRYAAAVGDDLLGGLTTA